MILLSSYSCSPPFPSLVLWQRNLETRLNTSSKSWRQEIVQFIRGHLYTTFSLKWGSDVYLNVYNWLQSHIPITMHNHGTWLCRRMAAPLVMYHGKSAATVLILSQDIHLHHQWWEGIRSYRKKNLGCGTWTRLAVLCVYTCTQTLNESLKAHSEHAHGGAFKTSKINA